MAVIDLNYLKTFFQTYDKPTEEEFSDLIDTLSTTLDITTYDIPGVGDVWSAVNFSTKIEHDQKQLTIVYHNGVSYLFDAPLGDYGLGGLTTVKDNYVVLLTSQFTSLEVEAILELITKDVSVEISINVTEFEQGLPTAIKYIADIHHEDVTVTSIKLNGVSKQIGINETLLLANETITLSKDYVLVIDYIKSGISLQQTYITIVNAYVPQFAGASVTSDYDNDSISAISLTKHIQLDSTIEYGTTFNNFYMWFILNDKTINLYDQNGLQFRVGEWLSTNYFKSKNGTIVLADGSIASVKLYRSKDLISSKGINFKFKSE